MEDVHAGALRAVSLEVGAGAVIGLAGAAGSGVHDLFDAIRGWRPYTQGRVLIDGGVYGLSALKRGGGLADG